MKTTFFQDHVVTQVKTLRSYVFQILFKFHLSVLIFHQTHKFLSSISLEVKFPYDPVRPSVGWTASWLVVLSAITSYKRAGNCTSMLLFEHLFCFKSCFTCKNDCSQENSIKRDRHEKFRANVLFFISKQRISSCRDFFP